MKKNYIFTLLLTLFISAFSFGQVIITEIADPNNNAGARFVELYIVGDSSVDFTGWELIRYTNAGTTISSNTVDLTSLGTLSKGSFAIIAANGATFQTVYGTPADISAGTGGPADSNGDDKIGIRDNMSVIIDIFGTPGVSSNNTNNAHNFEDGRAERIASVTGPTDTWNEAQWDTDNDQGFGSGAQDAPAGYDPKMWIGTSTSPIITLTGSTSSFDYFEGNGPSPEQLITVSGANLTADINIVAPTNFEISLTSGSGFGSAATITQTGGNASGSVYMRLAAGLTSNSYTGTITTSSTGATDKSTTLNGIVSPADPQFSYSAFLNDFNYVISVGGPSAEQTFTVEGLFLTNDIIVTAPTDFEVSLATGSGFASSVNITPNSGTVAETTIYARLKAGLVAGKYTGDITISSISVADKTIAVNGNTFGDPTNSMIITGAYDATLTGGTPKGIELYVLKNIADLSLFGISSVTNGGGSTAGNIEFPFPAGTASAGSFIYISTEDVNFTSFFGMAPTYTTGVVSINGDDSIELYENGQIIDVFGDVDMDGSGEAWDYLDGWAYRKSNTGPEGTTFTVANWTYSGIDVFDGASDNNTATSSFPIGTFVITTASVNNNAIEGFATYPNPVTGKEFTISSTNSDVKQVAVFNVLGKKVLSSQFVGTKSTIDISAINSGIYILKVTEAGKISTKKLVIK